MATGTVDQIAERQFGWMRHSREFQESRPLYLGMLRELAKGAPVAVERLVEVTGRPVAQVTEVLGDLGVEWDADGRLVGAGLSLRPTPHRIVVNGRILWAWCAFDTLLFPPLLEVSARVESPCRATGQPVSVDVTAQGVQRVDPATAVVSMLPPRELSDVRQQVCVYGHYFHAAEAAADWLARHPDGEVLPVAETFQVARRMARLFAGPPQHLV